LRLTRYDIPGIHGIFIFNESEAIHQLDLRDLAGAMRSKVSLDIGLGGCDVVSSDHNKRERANSEQWLSPLKLDKTCD
jgi:hypothetical protein